LQPTEVRLDKFTVIRRLGRGGMGAVYEAYDPALDRRVAIKTLHADVVADAESRSRFEREARAAAKLQHPNIVTIYELGNFGRKERPFIVMEYLEGSDVATLIEQEQRLLLSETLDIAVQLCNGLGYAHERGVVHRDVKPSNLRYLDDGRLKIMDFGIARVEGSAQLTRSGVMVGTLHYMAPEQISGDSIDGRADLFSAGCILYEMLRGRRPFPGESATSILYKIVHEQPEPVLTSRPELPQEVQQVLDRALAKRPADRFADSREMARALEAIQVVHRRTAARLPAALEGRVSDLHTLSKARRWGDVLSLAQQLLGQSPDLADARRAQRTARRQLHQEAAERAGDSAERTRHLEEISREFDELYGPSYAKTVVEEVPTRRPAAPVVENSVGADRTTTPVVATERASRPGRSAARVAAGVLAGALLITALIVWRIENLRGLFVDSAGVVEITREVRVSSDPPGARIWVNGVDTGLDTANEIPLTGKEGEEFGIELRKDGFHPGGARVKLQASFLAPVDLQLQVLTRKVSIGSQPAGASLMVDGESSARSSTPADLELPVDRAHAITLSREGYQSRTIRIPAGTEPVVENVALAPLGKPGTLAVRSSYPVRITAGGATLAESSSEPTVSLRAGRHEVTLSAPAVFLNRVVALEIAEGATAVVETPALGFLSVRASPSNCRVTIDGMEAETPPFDNQAIAAGTHRIEFEWPDGRKQVETKEIAAGQRHYVTARAR
jgi:tRNA A-37 threonylcarbamoyl transferase component Bud32